MAGVWGAKIPFCQNSSNTSCLPEKSSPMLVFLDMINGSTKRYVSSSGSQKIILSGGRNIEFL